MLRHLAVRLVLLLVASVPAASRAQAPVPSPTPDPVFVPGLYETESRNSAFEADDVKRRQCFDAADYDAFRRETIARFEDLPQFKGACRLSATRPTADGFAFAMDCTMAKTIVAFHFAKDLVSSTTRTRIAARPDRSSTILTLSRRIGDCRGPTPPRGQEL